MYKTSSKVGIDPIPLTVNSIDSNIYGKKMVNPYLIKQEVQQPFKIRNNKNSYCSVKFVFNIILILSIITIAVSLGILTEATKNEQGKFLAMKIKFNIIYFSEILRLELNTTNTELKLKANEQGKTNILKGLLLFCIQKN